MASKGGTGKSGYGHKSTAPKLPPITSPAGKTGAGRAGNVKPAKGSGGKRDRRQS
jgi:hypothetical protein